MAWHPRVFFRGPLNVTLDPRIRALRDRTTQNSQQKEVSQTSKIRSIDKIEQPFDISHEFLTSKHLFEQRKLFEQKEKNKFVPRLITKQQDFSLAYFQRHHPLYRPITKEIAEQWQRQHRHLSPLCHEKKELRELSKAIAQIRKAGAAHQKYPEIIENYLDSLQTKMVGRAKQGDAIGQAKVLMLLASMHRNLEKNAQTELAHMVENILTISQQNDQSIQLSILEKSELAGQTALQTILQKGGTEDAHQRAYHAVFVEAHRQTQEIRELTEKIVDHLQQTLQSTDMHQHEDLQALYKAMNLLVLIFDAKADFYLSKAKAKAVDLNDLPEQNQHNSDLDQKYKVANNLVQQPSDKSGMAAHLPDSIYLKPLPYKMYADYPVIKRQLAQLWNFETKHPSIAYYQPLDITGLRTRSQLFNLSHSLGASAPASGAIGTNSASWRITVSSLLTKAKMQTNSIAIDWQPLNGGLTQNMPDNTITQQEQTIQGLRKIVPVHELLSVAYTASFDTSLQLAQQICSEVWLVKSKGDISQLPVHFKKVYDFIPQHDDLPCDDESICSQLALATDILVELSRRFSEFEIHATAFFTLLKNNIWQPDTVQRYQLLCKKIAEHQFSSDQLPLYQVYQPASATEAFARIWDAYSSALGVAETTVVYRLAQYDQQQLARSKNLELTWHAFATRYKNFAQTLAQPKLPISQDDLYRYSSLIVKQESANYTEKFAFKHIQGTQSGAVIPRQDPISKDLLNTQVTLNTTAICPFSALAFGSFDGQISKTESHRYGELQYISLQKMDAGHFATSAPARKQIILGPELTYQVLHFDEMENYGLTKEKLAQLRNLPDIEKQVHRETLLMPFFTICTKNPSVQLRYFGLNSIGELLKNFSNLNNQAQPTLQNKAEQFEFIGFNIFGKVMMDAYLERTRIMHCAAKNTSSSHLPAQNIAALVGITPEQVKFLLAQPVPLDMNVNKSSTVSDFLQQANPEQRLAYYRQSDIGQQLFTAYLAIVETAKIIKNVLYSLPLEISQNARRPAHG